MMDQEQQGKLASLDNQSQPPVGNRGFAIRATRLVKTVGFQSPWSLLFPTWHPASEQGGQHEEAR